MFGKIHVQHRKLRENLPPEEEMCPYVRIQDRRNIGKKDTDLHLRCIGGGSPDKGKCMYDYEGCKTYRRKQN